MAVEIERKHFLIYSLSTKIQNWNKSKVFYLFPATAVIAVIIDFGGLKVELYDSRLLCVLPLLLLLYYNLVSLFVKKVFGFF